MNHRKIVKAFEKLKCDIRAAGVNTLLTYMKTQKPCSVFTVS